MITMMYSRGISAWFTPTWSAWLIWRHVLFTLLSHSLAKYRFFVTPMRATFPNLTTFDETRADFVSWFCLLQKWLHTCFLVCARLWYVAAKRIAAIPLHHLRHISAFYNWWAHHILCHQLTSYMIVDQFILVCIVVSTLTTRTKQQQQANQ